MVLLPYSFVTWISFLQLKAQQAFSALATRPWCPFSRCPSHILANSSLVLVLLWLQSCLSEERGLSTQRQSEAVLHGLKAGDSYRQLQTATDSSGEGKNREINTMCKQEQHRWAKNTPFCLIQFDQVEKKVLNY